MSKFTLSKILVADIPIAAALIIASTIGSNRDMNKIFPGQDQELQFSWQSRKKNRRLFLAGLSVPVKSTDAIT